MAAHRVRRPRRAHQRTGIRTLGSAEYRRRLMQPAINARAQELLSDLRNGDVAWATGPQLAWAHAEALHQLTPGDRS